MEMQCHLLTAIMIYVILAQSIDQLDADSLVDIDLDSWWWPNRFRNIGTGVCCWFIGLDSNVFVGAIVFGEHCPLKENIRICLLK
jgi:hypothetical protein